VALAAANNSTSGLVRVAGPNRVIECIGDLSPVEDTKRLTEERRSWREITGPPPETSGISVSAQSLRMYVSQKSDDEYLGAISIRYLMLIEATVSSFARSSSYNL
jgi:hypothetical protein